ncbi:MAG: SufE family protein [Abditibacteriaceae bacterium]
MRELPLPAGERELKHAKVLFAILTNMDTQQEQVQELIDTFSMLESWEDKYNYLIDLGHELPPLDSSQHVETNRVHGCQSNVWLVAVHAERDGQKIIEFIADSDSKIVCGLVAVLRRAYSGQTAEYISNYNVQELFEALELEQHLSMSRRNGLSSMVQRIQLFAESELSTTGEIS